MNPGQLPQNVILFGRILRSLGLKTNPKSAFAAIDGLTYIDMSKKKDFYFTLRTTLVNDAVNYPVFDKAFNTFWKSLSGNKKELLENNYFSNDKFQELQNEINPDSFSEKLIGNDSITSQSDKAAKHTSSYSYQEVLRNKDFSEITPNEKKEIELMISQIKWFASKFRSRRWESGKHGDPFWARTLRSNMRHGGEILRWSYHSPKLLSRPLVIIADISGSMELYSSFFLHFIHSFANKSDQAIESFVFSTRLTRITRQLQNKDIKFALKAASNIVEDWSGGTRIGESIKLFNRNWAPRVLRRNAVVILISDGWDRGDADVLRKEIALLRRNCSRLIWLNPLLGTPEYQPLTRGMQTSLPYIDDFLPAHNLASLEAFAFMIPRISRASDFKYSTRFSH